MKQNRCPYCNKLLYKGEIIEVEIKCPRCKKLVYFRLLEIKEKIIEYRDRTQKQIN